MACHTVSARKRDGGRVDGRLKLRGIKDVESDRQWQEEQRKLGKPYWRYSPADVDDDDDAC